MAHIFLYLNLFLFLIPIALAFDKKVATANIRSLIIPSLIVTVIYSETGVFFAGQKVWTFDSTYLLGMMYRQLPLEMYLFYFTSTFAGLGIYNYLNAKFPKNDLQKYSFIVKPFVTGHYGGDIVFCIHKVVYCYNICALIFIDVIHRI